MMILNKRLISRDAREYRIQRKLDAITKRWCLYYPSVNLALLRVSSFVGMLFGAVNMLVWFFVMPVGWWMGVLHIPLLTISLYAFILAQRGDKAGDSWEEN